MPAELATRWTKAGTNANSAPKPNNAWWRCAEFRTVQSPGNYLSAEAQQGSTAGSNGGGLFCRSRGASARVPRSDPDAPWKVLIRGESDRFRPRCRRKATASFFLGGTEHLTPHASGFGSVLKPGSADRSFPRWSQGANACGILCDCGTVLGSRAEALSGKYSDAMG
jgi:hypothetical protein